MSNRLAGLNKRFIDRQHYRSTKFGMADLNPWAVFANVVGDGPTVIQNKSGALLAGYFMQPPDSASCTDQELEDLSYRINQAQLPFGSGWTVHVDAFSYPSIGYPTPDRSFFPNEFARRVDEERRRAFQAEGSHYENERALCITYEPPPAQVTKLEKLLYTNPTGEDEPGLMTHVEEGFQRHLRQFEDSCGRLVRLRRMSSRIIVDPTGRPHVFDELLEYLNYCTTGKRHPIQVPESGAYLDVLVGGQEMWPGEIPIIGDDYVLCVTIDGFPMESKPVILARLATLAIPYRFSQRMIYLDTHHATKEINHSRDRWSQRVKPLLQTILQVKDPKKNQFAMKMVSETETAYSLAESGTVRYGFYTATVVLRHRDQRRVIEMARMVAQEMSECGFPARVESTNNIEAFRATLPGENHANVRRPLIHTMNFSDFMPLTAVWTGTAEAPHPQWERGLPPLLYARTTGSIPFRANLHVYDVGHSTVFGPTGSGKTTLLNLIVTQALRYKRMRITSFDYKYGMFATSLACGGRHYEFGGRNIPQLCPLERLEDENDQAWAAEWIATLYQLQTETAPSPGQTAEIIGALRQWRENGHNLRSLTHFQMAVQDAKVRQALEFYTVKGAAGFLLDGESETLDTRADFTVFETLDLMGMGEKTNLPVLLALFRRFERNLDGRPSLLILDEAWIALGHPVWREKLRGWLRLLRSKNCAVVMATQSLSDAVKSNLLDVLVESCPTKIFLPNNEAMMKGTPEHPGPNDFYRIMGLNDNQITLIRRAEAKREYYWTSHDGARIVDFGMGPAQLAVFGATSEADVRDIRDLIDEHGGQWLEHWFQKKGVNYAALG